MCIRSLVPLMFGEMANFVAIVGVRYSYEDETRPNLASASIVTRSDSHSVLQPCLLCVVPRLWTSGVLWRLPLVLGCVTGC